MAITSKTQTGAALKLYEQDYTQEEFGADKYGRVEGLSYPDDLLGEGNQYGGNYVVFFINVHQDSELFGSKNLAEGELLDGRAVNKVQSAAAGANAGTILGAGAVSGGVIGATTGAPSKAISKFAGGDLKGILKSVADTTLGAAGGLIVSGAVSTVLGGVKNQYKGLKGAIALHMPNDLSVKYGMKWGEADLAGTYAAGAAGESIVNMGAALKQKSLSAVSDAAAKSSVAASALGYGAGKALQVPGVGQLLSKVSGVAANPKKEQLFQEVQYRSFQFNYQFFPRSKSEAQNIQRIIKAFKIHMHPEYKPGSNEFLYIYPSEFDIVYYHNGMENTNIHRHTSCVLTDMSVNYSRGQWAAFEDGTPTQIDINMTFMELALLTKETIAAGY